MDKFKNSLYEIEKSIAEIKEYKKENPKALSISGTNSELAKNNNKYLRTDNKEPCNKKKQENAQNPDLKNMKNLAKKTLVSACILILGIVIFLFIFLSPEKKTEMRSLQLTEEAFKNNTMPAAIPGTLTTSETLPGNGQVITDNRRPDSEPAYRKIKKRKISRDKLSLPQNVSESQMDSDVENKNEDNKEHLLNPELPPDVFLN
jgi:hypothetical protein